MAHGKRWKTQFFLVDENGDVEFSMTFKNEYEQEKSVMIAENAIMVCALLRTPPRVQEVVVTMMCHTCGFESAQSDRVLFCKCDCLDS